MRSQSATGMLIGALFLGCAAAEGLAGDVIWNGPSGGDFNTGPNWDTGFVPGSGDTAVFTNLSQYHSITLSADAIVAGVRFGGPILDWTPSIGTGPYTWTVTNDFLVSIDADKAGVPTLSSGTLAITNPWGTAQLRVAPTGYGGFFVNGGTAIVDNIVATNALSGPNLWINKGTLRSLRSTLISRPSDFQINSYAYGEIAQWIMPSGVHTVLAVNGTAIAQTSDSTGMVFVAGTDTIWTNSGALGVGANGGGFLTITNGARVYNTSANLGGTPGARGEVLITGSTSTWELVGDGRYLYVAGNSGGGSSNENRLVVTNGGTLRMKGSSCNLTMGAGTLTHDNVVMIVGSNSLMDLGANAINMGYGPGQRLSVLNGGTLLAGSLSVGQAAAGTSCVVVVDGSDSRVVLTNDLTAGTGSAANRMTISGGARVYSAGTAGTIGGGAGSNLLTVTGAGSVWSNSKPLYVGNFGNWNTMVVSNGGAVYCGEVRLGENVGYRGDRLIVTGTNSLLCSTSDFNVARQAVYENELIVSDGGRVENVVGYLGLWSCQSNSALVTGAGSVWSNSSGLFIGNQSAWSYLTIKDGGKVYSTLGNIGQYWLADSNRVVVNGTGAEWICTSTFTVGGNGGGGGAWNEMMITNGGRVRTASGQYIAVGNAISSSWNRVFVTGAGSEWNATSGYIRVGGAGVSNELHISEGGLVRAAGFYLGAAAGLKARVFVSSGGTIEGGEFQNLGTSDARMENDGGIYQFTAAPPAVWPFAGGVYSLNNGVVSFRDVTAATISPIANLTYTGTNGFRLCNATNTAATDQSYVFDTGLGPTHYAGLDMVSGVTRYRSSVPASHTLNIGSNGVMLCSNTAATVDLTFRNDGILRIVNSTLTFARPATFNGTNVINLDRLANPDCVVTGADMSFGGALVLEGLGPITNRHVAVTLFAFTSRSGTFLVSGLPPPYRVGYDANRVIALRSEGSVFVVH